MDDAVADYIVLARGATTKNLFGGYSKTCMSYSGSWVNDNSAFMFKLTSTGSVTKYPVSEASVAVYFPEDGMIQFGDGPDLKIAADGGTSVS